MLTYSEFCKELVEACRSELRGYPLGEWYSEYLKSNQSIRRYINKILENYDWCD